ncbi:MAG TPA: hypothetical protein VJ570_03870 [Holophagaceae bacterium]|nr:hypothetical protein [Holophagaceae bacterium]
MLLDRITPPTVEQLATPETWTKFTSDCLAVSALVDLWLQGMKKDQAETIKELKGDRARMEADLRHPELERLRDLLDDPDFNAAQAKYMAAAAQARKKAGTEQDRQGPYLLSKEQRIGPLQGDYLACLMEFKASVALYAAKIDAASSAARKTVPGPATTAAVQALNIRLIQLVQGIVQFHAYVIR